MERSLGSLKVRYIAAILVMQFLGPGYCQDGEILPLSKKTGTVLDAEENIFYSVFTDVRGFESAQFYQMDDLSVSVRIVFVNRGIKKTSRRRMSLRDFVELQNRVNGLPQITDHDRDNLKKDLIYLQTDEILKSIPINRYVQVSRVSGMKIKGHLEMYDGRELIVRTVFGKRKVPITNLKAIAVRDPEKSRPRLKWLVPVACGSGGFIAASLFVPGKYENTDRETFYRFAGAAAGLTATGPVISRIQAYLTPMEVFNLNPELLKVSVQ